jgi:Resolvase, N terminal domain
MIAAIYARKSNDQNLPHEEKSVSRQLERARAFAERQGWQVLPEYVYTDDGISGAEFVKRPGFLALGQWRHQAPGACARRGLVGHHAEPGAGHRQ